MDFFRTDCIKSYFEIVALVNKGNKKVNEQTEAKFFIYQNKLFLGINEKQKIQLCAKKRQWAPANSGYEELEHFICQLLNNIDLDAVDLNDFIKRNLFKLPD